jgi:hypothetical protein
MYQWEIIELQAQTGEWKQAFIHEGLTPKALQQCQAQWRPMLTAMEEADAHWNWTGFWETYAQNAAHTFFHLECDGSLQGLLWLESGSFNSWDNQGSPLVYVHRLCVAPWNRGSALQRRFKPVGMVLLRHAALWSWDAGFVGRIGLHSLPKAVHWYQDILKMSAFGKDSNHENLEYFEITKVQAVRFLKGQFG